MRDQAILATPDVRQSWPRLLWQRISQCLSDQTEHQEIKYVFFCSLLAALHVFVFTATFPFFNSVDEPYHFDLVVRYSQGQIPREVEPFSTESIHFLVLFCSIAYLTDPAWLPRGKLT